MAERKRAEPVTPPSTDETRTRAQAEAEAAKDDVAKAQTKAQIMARAAATGTEPPPEPRGGYPPAPVALPGSVSAPSAEHTPGPTAFRIDTPEPPGPEMAQDRARFAPQQEVPESPEPADVKQHFEVLRQALIADPRLKAKVMSLARQLQHHRIGPFTDFIDAITAS